MNDMMNENQSGQQMADDAQQTKAVAPVETQSTGRRRRTERNRDSYVDAAAQGSTVANAPVAAVKPEQGVEQAAETRAQQVAPAANGTTVVPRFQTRYNPTAPSQGVPRPGMTPTPAVRRPNVQASTGNVRRPVNAEGYSPIQPLGAVRPAEEPEGTSGLRVRRPEAQERMRPPMMDEDVQYDEDEQEGGKGRGLIVIIIVLLVLAAGIVGLMLIPDDDTGVLGQIKNTVMTPIRSLMGSGKGTNTAPAEASGFTATLAQDTAPYKIVFNLVTSSGVTAVRVVDAQGNAMPTITTLSYPNNENTIVWIFEMTLETGYEGIVQAQIQDGDTWVDTGLQQTLSIGTSAPPTISSVPANTAVIAGTAVPAEPTATLTADSTMEPTVSPAMEEISIPTATLEAAVVVAETVSPMPDPTLEATATPTLAVTATPTVRPTDSPTPEPTEVPTPTPTLEPTATPTPEPTATPVVTPRLEAMAADSADPDKLITTQEIYTGGKEVDEYQRSEEDAINMLPADDYLSVNNGVNTFRGSSFRQNAAYGTVTNPTSMTVAWMVSADSAAGSSRAYNGIGWTGQPVIIKWPKEIRQALKLNEGRANQTALKEVIVAGMDGRIYFLDLNDGTATREPINLGYPMRSTPSLHPMGFPMMTVGQYAFKMKNGNAKEMGLRYYDLTNHNVLRLIDGWDKSAKRSYYSVGAFDTSALIDRTSNTLITVGTNGLLYTEKLSMKLYQDVGGGPVKYEFGDPTQVVLMSHTKGQKTSYAAVESSLAMYGSYAYYADMDGILRCVDTNTMTTIWAVDTGDAVKAAIALDLDEDTNTLWLYTANTVTNRSKGDVTIRRYNAMTGEEDWSYAVHCSEGKKKDATNNKVVTPGAMASPVVGRNDLNGMVYFTLSSLSRTGGKQLNGEDAAVAGVVIALSKETGDVVWYKTMDAYCYSSPVAVYDENGRGWLIQACSNGTLYLMDGLTGETINTLQINGTVEGSPAVYGSMLVIGTSDDEEGGCIYGIQLN